MRRTDWKRLWCWEGLKAGGEGDDRGWDGWMASLTQWTWVWVGSGSWWWTGKPSVLQSMGSQRVGHDWETELNWTDLCVFLSIQDKHTLLAEQMASHLLRSPVILCMGRGINKTIYKSCCSHSCLPTGNELCRPYISLFFRIELRFE